MSLNCYTNTENQITVTNNDTNSSFYIEIPVEAVYPCDLCNRVYHYQSMIDIEIGLLRYRVCSRCYQILLAILKHWSRVSSLLRGIIDV